MTLVRLLQTGGPISPEPAAGGELLHICPELTKLSSELGLLSSVGEAEFIHIMRFLRGS